MKLDLLISLLIALASHAGEISALITKAKGEGRDVTDEELRGLLDSDTAALARLDDTIARIKAASDSR